MQGVTQTDPRRLIPRTDHLLALPAAHAARARLGDATVRALVRDLQERARRGALAPDEVEDLGLAGSIPVRLRQRADVWKGR